MNPQVRIIGSSGLTTNGGIARMSGAPLDHFVAKPYTADALLHKIKEALGNEPGGGPDLS